MSSKSATPSSVDPGYEEDTGDASAAAPSSTTSKRINLASAAMVMAWILIIPLTAWTFICKVNNWEQKYLIWLVGGGFYTFIVCISYHLPG